MERDLDKFLQNLADNKLPIVRKLTGLRQHSNIVREVDFQFDNDVNEYEKSIDKPYFIQADVEFEDFVTCFDVELVDYGLPPGDREEYVPDEDSELARARNGYRSGTLFLKVVNELPRQPSVTLQGTITGDGLDIDDYQSRTLGVFSFEGLSSEDARTSLLSQQLILDAYSFEREGHLKAAFLTYFTALEALVTESLAPVRAALFTELHEALEHLPLDAKMKVAAKHALATADVKTTIPIWGALMGKLRTTEDSRNDIVHGKSAQDVIKHEVDDALACVAVFAAIVQSRLVDDHGIKQHYYPKEPRRR